GIYNRLFNGSLELNASSLASRRLLASLVWEDTDVLWFSFIPDRLCALGSSSSRPSARPSPSSRQSAHRSYPDECAHHHHADTARHPPSCRPGARIPSPS